MEYIVISGANITHNGPWRVEITKHVVCAARVHIEGGHNEH